MTGRHVHFVERGQDGVGRLRLQQALGDAGAQAAHRHALLRAVAQVGRARSAPRPAAGLAIGRRGRHRHRRGRRQRPAWCRPALAPSTSPLVTRPSCRCRRRRWWTGCCRPAACAAAGTAAAPPCGAPPPRRRAPPQPRHRTEPAVTGVAAVFVRSAGFAPAPPPSVSITAITWFGSSRSSRRASRSRLSRPRRAPALRARPCRSRSRSGFRPGPRLRPPSCATEQRCLGHGSGQLRDLHFYDCHEDLSDCSAGGLLFGEDEALSCQRLGSNT